MMPVKSSCTYLKLCGSINDALWDDEYRIVTGWEQKYEEEGSEQRDAAVEEKRENLTWGISHFSSHRTLQAPKSLRWTSKLRWGRACSQRPEFYCLERPRHHWLQQCNLSDSQMLRCSSSCTEKTEDVMAVLEQSCRQIRVNQTLGEAAAHFKRYSRSGKPCQ